MTTASAMLLRGWGTGLETDEVLMPDEVFAAHDEQGHRYLIAHTRAAIWLCAPISERALSCVVSGRAELRAVFSHSSTGMVELLTVCGATVCKESTVPCAELPDEVLPEVGVRLGWQARCA
jgi:hypothetical protein